MIHSIMRAEKGFRCGGKSRSNRDREKMRDISEQVVVEAEKIQYGIGYADAGQDLGPRAVSRQGCSFGFIDRSDAENGKAGSLGCDIVVGVAGALLESRKIWI
jgi:hypothetical protein